MSKSYPQSAGSAEIKPSISYICIVEKIEKRNMTYTIKLPQFEGPFDLLLFFIERDELDIYDIPISKIADDFLAYIHHMEMMNIDLASDFILVASTLMRIKAKMLIPRKEIDEAGNEIDPREELVQRLLEYKRYKSVLEEMRSLEANQAGKRERGYVNAELKGIATKALVDVEMESLTLYKILRAFENCMTRFEYANRKVVHKVVRYNYTLSGQKQYLLDSVHKLKKDEKISFETVFSSLENRMHAIFTFLALLELVQLKFMSLVIGEGENNFWLTPLVDDEG